MMMQYEDPNDRLVPRYRLSRRAAKRLGSVNYEEYTSSWERPYTFNEYLRLFDIEFTACDELYVDIMVNHITQSDPSAEVVHTIHEKHSDLVACISEVLMQRDRPESIPYYVPLFEGNSDLIELRQRWQKKSFALHKLIDNLYVLLRRLPKSQLSARIIVRRYMDISKCMQHCEDKVYRLAFRYGFRGIAGNFLQNHIDVRNRFLSCREYCMSDYGVELFDSIEDYYMDDDGWPYPSIRKQYCTELILTSTAMFALYDMVAYFGRASTVEKIEKYKEYIKCLQNFDALGNLVGSRAGLNSTELNFLREIRYAMPIPPGSIWKARFKYWLHGLHEDTIVQFCEAVDRWLN